MGNLDDYFSFKLPETDQRRNNLPLTGTGQKNQIAQALSNEPNVKNDVDDLYMMFKSCSVHVLLYFMYHYIISLL